MEAEAVQTLARPGWKAGCRYHELGPEESVGVVVSGSHYRNAMLMKKLVKTGNVRVENIHAYKID